MTPLSGPTPIMDARLEACALHDWQTSLPGPTVIDIGRNLERLLAEAVGALEMIMHARRNPNVPLTDMSRAGMRELAGEALARIKAAKEQM